jgi:hypothetical protein
MKMESDATRRTKVLVKSLEEEIEGLNKIIACQATEIKRLKKRAPDLPIQVESGKAWQNICNGLADSVLELSDKEIIDEVGGQKAAEEMSEKLRFELLARINQEKVINRQAAVIEAVENLYPGQIEKIEESFEKEKL